MQTNNKLREAVVEIIDYLEPIRKWTMPSKENDTKLTALFAAVDTVYTKAKNALAEPPRNCDVGTAEEQCRRFRKYCGCRCLTKCKVYEKGIALGIVNYNNYYKADCRFIWAQMPYTEGGAK